LHVDDGEKGTTREGQTMRNDVRRCELKMGNPGAQAPTGGALSLRTRDSQAAADLRTS